jgi:hypothetical protein
VKNAYILASKNGQIIVNAIWDSTAIAVSDGSQKALMGTSAFVIERETSEGRVGVNIAPGNVRTGDSHCCKLAGLYTSVIIANIICDIHFITTSAITVGCDNQPALRVFDTEYVFATTQ